MRARGSIGEPRRAERAFAPVHSHGGSRGASMMAPLTDARAIIASMVSGNATEGANRNLDLLYPFYLDTDMSMAFAAALAGGVALESEEVDRSEQTSEALRNLRGNLRLFAAEFGGGRGRNEIETAATESRLIRRHTDASIFIALNDELRRANRLVEHPDPSALSAGEIVSLRMGPAVAPLRRVVDQVVRLLDVMLPVLTGDAADAEEDAKPHQGSKRARPGTRPRRAEPADEGIEALRRLHGLFLALRTDLERTGMIDIAVAQEDGPSAVITLDERFVSGPCLELLHTSMFTIVGKVTHVWRTPEDVANLYRRSVVALLPSLAQSIAWGMLTLLGAIARSLDPEAMRLVALQAAGVNPADVPEAPSEGGTPPPADPATGTTADPIDEVHEQPEPESQAQSSTSGEVLFGDELIAAMSPVITGPAFQILPLAICS
jgi:hypothetical protein